MFLVIDSDMESFQVNVLSNEDAKELIKDSHDVYRTDDDGFFEILNIVDGELRWVLVS